MKKLIRISLCLSIITVLTSTAVFSQQFENRTSCDMIMTGAWGTPGCVFNGFFATLVPAFSSAPIPVPPGDQLLICKGHYVGSLSCLFYVGVPCSGYPMNEFVPCSSPLR